MELQLSLLGKIRAFCAFAVVSGSVASAQFQTHQRMSGTFRGTAAIKALGSELPAVARGHGITVERLTELLEKQNDLAVDQNGSLLSICDGMAISVSAAQVAPSSAAGPAITVLNSGSVDATRLHSLPGAQRIIFLDFDGHTTSGTQWNTTKTGGANIVSQPFDLDGAPWNFNIAEQSVIRGVWQRVAEDYAPFGIDVTTEDPGVEALRKTSSTDNAYGIRVVISPTNWYNGSAGGVAYIGAFNWNSDTPCYAFTLQLANGEKYIAESVSHEAGHTLGLYHDGASGTEYYQGHGNWAPIMGVGYYKAITQFSRGEYAGANNTQDDFAVIASYAPLGSDDHSPNLSSGTTLYGPSVRDGGTIERSGDTDLFQFTTAAGYLTLDVRGPAPEPNLDIRAELLNSSGQVVQASEPADLNASIAANVSGGTYYLKITGVGSGSPSSTGYSNYGSVGNYVILGTIPSFTTYTPQAPGSLSVVASNGRVELNWAASTAATTYRVFRSTTTGGPYWTVADSVTSTQYSDSSVSNGTTYFYVVAALNAAGESAASPQASATPSDGGTTSISGLVTSANLGRVRNDFTGWVGMRFTVGSSAIMVSQLGRIVVAGNSSSHILKLVRASDGSDVAGGSTTVHTAMAAAGQFRYGALAATVTLGAGESFYLVSEETAWGDQWYDYDTEITATSAATVTAAVYGFGPGTWSTIGSPNRSYIPVDLSYTLPTATQPPPLSTSGTGFVTGSQFGTARNNYSGWVGARIVVSANPLTVTQVGRIYAPGNSGAHTVKFVRASDGLDVPGGSTTVVMSGGKAGSFQYGDLSAPIVLSAYETYYLISQETNGGDQWYDCDTHVLTTPAANVSGAVWGSGSGNWGIAGGADRSYVPVTFKYTAGGVMPNGGAYVTTVSPGGVRNNFSGWVGMKIVVGGSSITVSQLGRLVASGNNGSHAMKLVRASDGADVPGSTTTVALSGGIPGQFRYGHLTAPITLQAGESYYLVSLESNGGDTWYDCDTRITTTSQAVTVGALWGFGDGSWYGVGQTNNSYVGLSWQ